MHMKGGAGLGYNDGWGRKEGGRVICVGGGVGVGWARLVTVSAQWFAWRRLYAGGVVLYLRLVDLRMQSKSS